MISFQWMNNENVWNARSVDWYEMDATEARNDENIVFNFGDDATETVRIVEIDSWDIVACSGTHVRNSKEIGPIQVLNVLNPGG